MSPEERASKLYDDCHAFLRDRAVPIMADAIREAVTEEREACAKLADNAQLEDEGHWQAREIAERLAVAIRKRGEQPAVEVKGAG